MARLGRIALIVGVIGLICFLFFRSLSRPPAPVAILRVVDASLPATAPMRDRIGDLLGRFLKNQSLAANPDPIVLKKGAILKITVPPEFRTAPDAPLWGQISAWNYDPTFWVHPEAGML